MKLLNYTKHPVQIWNNDDNCVVTIPSEPEPIRCKENYELLEKVEAYNESIEIGLLSYSADTELPLPQPDTLLIVSVLVAQMYPWRQDLVVPYDLVRNVNGSIIGCRKLVRML